jgi:pimeloyl-ACP methyl ester carboxylesterase
VSGAGGLAYQSYEWAAGREWMMRIGEAGPAVLFLPPLFEEMNRTRALIAATMRGIARRGFRCWLPDLPGTGESRRRLEEVSWADWQGAVAAVAADSGAALVASLRGGCLLDDMVAGRRWRFAPTTGASLLRDLGRSRLVNDGSDAAYPVDKLQDDLSAAVASDGEARIVRLASDPADADRKIAGSALWRRSEPAGAPALAEALAEDIAGWARQ